MGGAVPLLGNILAPAELAGVGIVRELIVGLELALGHLADIIVSSANECHLAAGHGGGGKALLLVLKTPVLLNKPLILLVGGCAAGLRRLPTLLGLNPLDVLAMSFFMRPDLVGLPH